MGRRLKTYGFNVPIATIATTGVTSAYVIVPKSGTIVAAMFSSVDALAVHAANYLTFSITNLGQAGAGALAVLAATAANSTNSAGGTAIAANTKRTLTLNGTAANLLVTEGDRLQFTSTAAATSANTNTFGNLTVLVDASGA